LVAHLSARHNFVGDFIFQQIVFSADLAMKKFASFSPEFLVLTTTPVLRTHPSATTTCARLRRVLKKMHLPAQIQPAVATNCKVL
jgi:hypothetical protein